MRYMYNDAAIRHQLIVTADDYGLYEPVNEAIEDCLAARTVRATDVMINMPACISARDLRHRFSDISLGIHWTLTQGKPVLPAICVPSLVDSNGQFFSFRQFRQRWLARKIKVADIRNELIAQSQHFYDLMGRPDFWNTHESIHIYPVLFQIFVTLGQELGISAMRCNRRIVVPYRSSALKFNWVHPFHWLKGILVAKWSSQTEALDIAMPDGIVLVPGYSDGKAAINDFAQRIPWSSVNKAIELVIHPATNICQELFGNLTESRLKEYAIFRDPALKDRLEQIGISAVEFEVLTSHRDKSSNFAFPAIRYNDSL